MVFCFCSEDSESDSYEKEESTVTNQIESVKELKVLGKKTISLPENGERKGKQHMKN